MIGHFLIIFKLIAVPLKPLKVTQVAENHLILELSIQNNQATIGWREVNPILVVLVLAEKKLRFRAVVKALKYDDGNHDPYSSALWECKPRLYGIRHGLWVGWLVLVLFNATE